MEFAIRPVTGYDISFLREMLRYAAHATDESDMVSQAGRGDPRLLMWLQQWGRPGDRGLIAFDSKSLRGLGAAWLRLLSEASSTGYYDDRTPELAMAVLPEYMGMGIGSALLSALIDTVKTTVPAIVLTVRAGNPARHLYERNGFVVIGEVLNRAGTTSSHMLLKLN